MPVEQYRRPPSFILTSIIFVIVLGLAGTVVALIVAAFR